MSQSLCLEPERSGRMESGAPARRPGGSGVLTVATVLFVGALVLALAVLFALVLAGLLPQPGAVVPLFTT